MKSFVSRKTGRMIKYLGATRWNARLFLGNGFDAMNVERLQSLGVTAVANLTNDPMHQDILARGDEYPFKTLVLDQEDSEAIPFVTIDRFLEWMDQSWAEGHTIFIHCHAGISRTPSFFISWLLHCTGCDCETDLRREWSKWEDEIGARRSIIHPHYMLKRSIIQYFEAVRQGMATHDDGINPDSELVTQ